MCASGSSRPWLPLFFSLALACSAGAQELPPAAPTDSPKVSASAAPLSQPSVNPADLPARLRQLAALLRTVSDGWNEDSVELPKRVAELLTSLDSAGAEAQSLRESLTSLTALLESSKKAHADELAAARASLESQIAALEARAEAAERAARLWRGLTMVASGAAAGALIGGPTGAMMGAAAGAVAAVFVDG